MPEVIYCAQAPSNIALIKYMGKKNSSLNIPANPSISMTLNALCSFAEIEVRRGKGNSVMWVPELPRLHSNLFNQNLSFQVPLLGDSGISRVIHHFERVRTQIFEIFSQFGIPLSIQRFKDCEFLIRTANTFPPSSGIASSASSFAALTLAAAMTFAEDPEGFELAWSNDSQLKRALARVSRQGSGSSCRSFEGPWVLWEKEDAAGLRTDMPEMAHFVILIKSEPKEVSSSAAHSRIFTSPLWEGRVERAESRTRLVTAALEEGDLPTLARITWAEAWEMHSLFHTSAEPFSYWEPGTVRGLQLLSPYVHEPIPPIVTLDAGPNIHVMVEKSQRNEWRARLRDFFRDYSILEDLQGAGARTVRVSG